MVRQAGCCGEQKEAPGPSRTCLAESSRWSRWWQPHVRVRRTGGDALSDAGVTGPDSQLCLRPAGGGLGLVMAAPHYQSKMRVGLETGRPATAPPQADGWARVPWHRNRLVRPLLSRGPWGKAVCRPGCQGQATEAPGELRQDRA